MKSTDLEQIEVLHRLETQLAYQMETIRKLQKMRDTALAVQDFAEVIEDAGAEITEDNRRRLGDAVGIEQQIIHSVTSCRRLGAKAFRELAEIKKRAMGAPISGEVGSVVGSNGSPPKAAEIAPEPEAVEVEIQEEV